MNFKKWNVFYQLITKDLGLNKQRDEQAAELLNCLLNGKKIVQSNVLKKIIAGKDVVVFGAGSSLEKTLAENKNEIRDMVKISADGATSCLIKNGINPDIIVSDLDGKIDDQVKANQKGSIMVVHSHGDNIDKIQNIVPVLQGLIIGTTQINPFSYHNLYNFGGFTDGDRAVFLADHYGAKKIYLVGFDFNNKIGKYSFTKAKNIELKKKKLLWCKKLLNEFDNLVHL